MSGFSENVCVICRVQFYSECSTSNNTTFTLSVRCIGTLIHYIKLYNDAAYLSGIPSVVNVMDYVNILKRFITGTTKHRTGPHLTTMDHNGPYRKALDPNVG